MSSTSRYVIGIDLGTTNTALAYIDTLDPAPRTRVLPIPQLESPGKIKDSATLPSACYLASQHEADEGVLRLPFAAEDAPARRAVGAFALNQSSSLPGRVIHSAKSWLCHGEVDRRGPILPWGSDEVAEAEKLSPVAASAEYLKHLRLVWDAALGRFDEEFTFRRQEIVLTVPASFDEAAQRLTREAVSAAGYPSAVRLLEEPQAAFYNWLEGDAARQELPRLLPELARAVQTVLICDVGGGTTDFSLFEITPGATDEIKRIAVSEHILLGGDNFDLSLARILEEKLAGGAHKLSRRQWSHLVFQARLLKERILSEGEDSAPLEEFFVSVPGEGSGLFSQTLSAAISRHEFREVVLQGFFPECGADAEPIKSAAGLREWGLPYAADSGISRHMAGFLKGRRVDAVLCTGGTLKPLFLQRRLCAIIAAWQDGRLPAWLRIEDPDLAVARGAARFAWLKRGRQGIIRGGYPRSIYLELLPDKRGAAAQLICLLPKGFEEGGTASLGAQKFELVINRPARFQLYHASRRAADRTGDLAALDAEAFHPLPALQTVLGLPAGWEKPKNNLITVTLETQLTEMGVLELNCLADQNGEQHRWRLDFQLRREAPAAPGEAAGANVGAERIQRGLSLIEQLYGKAQRDLEEEARPKGLVRRLEAIFGLEKTEWNLPLLRAMWPALEKGLTKRGRSLAHEVTWLNLAGYCLRPGCGADLNAFRMKELWRCFSLGLSFPKEGSAWVQWWIMWRRVAGGLQKEQQQALLDHILPQLGQSSADLAEMFRLASSLERVPVEARRQLGALVVKRLLRSAAAGSDHLCWAFGRLCSRIPLFGDLNCVIPPEDVEAWFTELTRLDWRRPIYRNLNAAFAQACRLTGDRARDISPQCRAAIGAKIKLCGGTERQLRFITELMPFESADQSLLFGESLPAGLRLLLE